MGSQVVLKAGRVGEGEGAQRAAGRKMEGGRRLLQRSRHLLLLLLRRRPAGGGGTRAVVRAASAAAGEPKTAKGKKVASGCLP